MAIHYSYLGLPSHHLADQDGYLPEPGDHWEDFNYHIDGFTSEQWTEYIERCAVAIKESQRAINEFRRSDQ